MQPEVTVSEPRLVTQKAQPALAVRLVRPMAELDIGALFGERLHRVFEAIEASGLRTDGPPFARYFIFGPDVCDMEIGVPVESVGSVAAAPPGSEDVGATELPAGESAMVEHRGPYPTLGQAYARIQTWFTDTGRSAGIGPWESYVAMPGTAPGELRTDLYWPVG